MLLATTLLGTGIFLLAGCGTGKFFPKPTPNPPSNTVGDYIYVGNNTGTLAGFGVSTTGGLTGITGLPLQAAQVGITTLAIPASNAYLYAGTAAGVYLFSINASNGAITVQNSGNSLISGVLPGGLQTESTGKFLLVSGVNGSTTAPSLASFSINSDGTLATVTAPVDVPNIAVSSTSNNLPGQIAITPTDSFAYMAMGSSGVAVYTFNTSGALAVTNLILTPGSSGGVANQDICLAIDPTGRYLYVGESNAGLRAFTIGANGALAPIAGSPYTVGGQPRAIAFDSTGGFLYVVNAGSGTNSNTVSEFSVSNGGALVPLNPATVAAGTSPVSLTVDQSKKYMAVANSGGTPDLQIYSFDGTTTGKLDAGATAATSSSSPGGAAVVVGTH